MHAVHKPECLDHERRHRPRFAAFGVAEDRPVAVVVAELERGRVSEVAKQSVLGLAIRFFAVVVTLGLDLQA